MTPEQKELFDQLTQLQQRVSTNVLAGMSQRQAYYEAGGKAKNDVSADSTVYEILSNPQVVSFMDSMKVQAVNKAIMDREEAMEILSALSRGKLTDIVKFRTANIGKDLETGADVNQTVWEIDEDLQLNDPDKLIIISELEVGKFGPKIKTHSKIAAIQQLAKMQGWEAAQKIDHSSTDGTMSPKSVDAELVGALVDKLIG